MNAGEKKIQLMDEGTALAAHPFTDEIMVSDTSCGISLIGTRKM